MSDFQSMTDAEQDEARFEAYNRAHADCETCGTNVCKDKTCDCGSDLGRFDPESGLWFCANLTSCKRGRRNTLIGRAIGKAMLSGDDRFFVPPSAEGQALVDVLCSVLSARSGEVLTPDVIRDRAAQAAAAVLATYKLEVL